MHKLRVGNANIFCDFFTSTVGFQQNSAEFFAKPAGILLNRAVNSIEFRSSNIFLFLSHINYIKTNFFLIFNDFFQNFQNAIKSVGTIFHCRRIL
jgi:hypothetical protein